MKTKNWPIFILFAYFFINILLVIPVIKLCFFGEHGFDYSILYLGLGLAVIMLLAQYFLFELKIDIYNKRLIPKRKITGYVIMLSLILGLLTLLLLFVLIFTMFGEGNKNPISNLGEGGFFITLLLLFFGSWFFWGYSFYKQYNESNPNGFVNRTITMAMAGSVLELLIAIPSHIIMRNRGDCCAPGISFLAILLSTSVLLFSFGPGILFLYLKRMEKKKGNLSAKDNEPLDQIR